MYIACLVNNHTDVAELCISTVRSVVIYLFRTYMFTLILLNVSFIHNLKISPPKSIFIVDLRPIFLRLGEPGSSVGIATDYGLDGPVSNPGGDEIFRPSRPALGPTQPPVQWVPGLSRGLSAAGACC